MLTGFNTDVNHEGKTFHVQTEDKGESNPVIETLIYEGGQILASRRQDYAEQAGSGMSRETLVALMERQHQAVVRDIRLGKYDPPELRRPFGEGIISDRSLDELVRELIEAAAAEGNLPPSPAEGRSHRKKGGVSVTGPGAGPDRPAAEGRAVPAATKERGSKPATPGKGAPVSRSPESGKIPEVAVMSDTGKSDDDAETGRDDNRVGKPYRIGR
jgi:hypothetical protein